MKKPPLLELLEWARDEMERISGRQPPLMSVEELAVLIWWTQVLCRLRQDGTATRH